MAGPQGPSEPALPGRSRVPQHDPFRRRQRLARYFFFAAFLALLRQTFRMLAVFYVPLLAAGLLAAAVYPMHARLLKRFPSRRSAAAAASAILTLLVVVLPLCAIGWVFFNEAAKIAPEARRWAAGVQARLRAGEVALPELAGLRARAAALAPGWFPEPEAAMLSGLEALGTNAAALAGAVLRNLLVVALDLAALGFSLFVFLRDGPGLLRTLLDLVPLPLDQKETLRARVVATLSAVVHGVLGVAALQGALAAAGLAAFGVPFAVLLGALTALAAPIPIVGVGVILGPVVAGLYLSGAAEQAWKVGLWSFFVVGMIDNFLKPFWIGAQSGLPVWLLLLGVLGGIRLYGFAGLLIGPVLVALALSLAAIYHREYDLSP